MESKNEIIKDLTDKNEQLVQQNQKMNVELKVVTAQLKEAVEQKNKMQNALFERDR